MRTTVTLDPDVVHMLQATMAQRGLSFKEVLNAAVREGLVGKKRPDQAFQIEAVGMGEPRIDLTKALALSSHLEDEEILHKISMRK